MAALHPDRPEKTYLPGALEDRQHEGVHDTDEGDHDGQGQQGIDQPEQLVHLGLQRLIEGGPGLDLKVGVGLEPTVDSALTNWCVESVESLVDLVHGVKQVHGQPQIAFAICGIYSAVRELMVTLLSGAVLAGKHN